MKISAVRSLIESEHAVRHGNMIVDVEVQAPSEALRKANGSALSAAEPRDAGALTLPAKDLLHEEPSHRRECTRLACEEKTELERDAEHPLPHGDVANDVHRQMRGGPAHPTRVSRWAHSSPLARQRDQHVLAARPTACAQESMRQYSAFQILAQLLLDVVGKPALVFLSRLRENVSRCSATMR